MYKLTIQQLSKHLDYDYYIVTQFSLWLSIVVDKAPHNFGGFFVPRSLQRAQDCPNPNSGAHLVVTITEVLSSCWCCCLLDVSRGCFQKKLLFSIQLWKKNLQWLDLFKKTKHEDEISPDHHEASGLDLQPLMVSTHLSTPSSWSQPIDFHGSTPKHLQYVHLPQVFPFQTVRSLRGSTWNMFVNHLPPPDHVGQSAREKHGLRGGLETHDFERSWDVSLLTNV